MQSNFRAENLKKAKWLLTKNLEIAQDRQQEMYPKVEEKKPWWYYLKLRIFGL